MLSALVLIAALAAGQSQPGSIADQASQPLWRVAEGTELLAAVDAAPAMTAPDQPFNANFWIFQPAQTGVDAIAAAITVDCGTRSVVHHSFSGYAGTTFVGAAAAADGTAQPAEPGTVYGALIEHLCDPHTQARDVADFADFRAAQAARGGDTGAR